MTEADYLLMCGPNSHDIRRIYHEVFGRPEDEWDKASEMSCQWILKEIKLNGIAVKPGLNRLLIYLKDRGIPIALASGCNNPKQCLVLEDSINGIRAAKNGGFPCTVVPDMVDSYTGNEDCCFRRLNTLDETIPVLEEMKHIDKEEE